MNKESGNRPAIVFALLILGLLVACFPSIANYLVLTRAIHASPFFEYPPMLAAILIVPAFALRTTRLPSWYCRPLAVLMFLLLFAVSFFKPFNHDLWRYNWDNNRMAPLACCFIASLLLSDILFQHRSANHDQGKPVCAVATRPQAAIWAAVGIGVVILFEMLPWLIPTQDHTSKERGILLIALHYIGTGSLIALIWQNNRWKPLWLSVISLVVSLLPLAYLAIKWITVSWTFPYVLVALVNVTNLWIGGIYAAFFGMGVTGIVSAMKKNHDISRSIQSTGK